MTNFNPETNSNVRPIEHAVSFAVREQLFRIPMTLPEYIKRKLDGAEGAWDVIVKDVRVYADDLISQAALLGFIGATAAPLIDSSLATYTKQRVYDEFCKLQRAAGNDAWEVPESLTPSLLVMA